MVIPEKLIKKTKKWLGKEGTVFFTTMLLEHSTISPVFIEGNLPHVVHFREGMQVRNFLRMQKECKNWDDCQLDDNWMQVIELAIKS
jgi:hypothetical protein